MRSLIRLLMGVLATALMTLAGSSASAKSLSLSDYQYPYQNPYFATITARLLKPSRVLPQIMMIDGLKGRNSIPLVEGRDRLDVALFAQKKKAPLIFIVPGVGGTASDGAALWLGELYNRAGFNAIVLPSPFFWKFVLSQSRLAVPGFTPEDARDLRDLMVKAKAMAEKQYGIRVSRLAVAGYSLGAVDAAFVMKLEREEPVLGLERVVMINPPLHIPYAIEKLDRMNALGDHVSAEARDALWGYVINVGAGALARDIDDPTYFMGLDRILNLKDSHLKYLIGNAFRQTLADTIFLSQQIRDIGLLKVKADQWRRNAREAEAAKITFIQYLERGAWPFWIKKLGKDWSLDQFVEQGDMLAIRPLLARDSAFRLLHNADDFLTRSSDLEVVAEEMGPRAIVYPLGGHVGNLWGEQNKKDLLSQVSDLLH